jgi:hypothetical protein
MFFLFEFISQDEWIGLEIHVLRFPLLTFHWTRDWGVFSVVAGIVIVEGK